MNDNDELEDQIKRILESGLGKLQDIVNEYEKDIILNCSLKNKSKKQKNWEKNNFYDR